MTKEKPIGIIEKDLYEVLADKTLSFGCKVMCYDPPNCEKCKDRKLNHGNPARVYDINFIKHGHRAVYKNGNRFHTVDPEMGFEIIGHEPTLNDVLLKLGDPDFLRYNKSEWCLKLWSKDGIIYIAYDLTKSFDSQTEETKRKLHNLICTK